MRFCKAACVTRHINETEKSTQNDVIGVGRTDVKCVQSKFPNLQDSMVIYEMIVCGISYVTFDHICHSLIFS